MEEADNKYRLYAIQQLDTIFQNKNWNSHDFRDFTYNNFCDLFLNLTSSQIKLILDLTTEYIWLTTDKCKYSFYELFKNFENNNELSNIKKIIIFPIMKPYDEAITKSGHVMLYMLRSIQPMLDKFEEIRLEEYESYEILQKYKFSEHGEELLFLVDDFLGTSETISETILEINKNKTLSKDYIHVFSIAAQKDSMDFLKEENILLHTYLELKKGISDYFKGDEIINMKKIMSDIEDNLLRGVGTYRFGYLQSEALVTLLRTPDNTFPVFWQNYRVGKKKYKAPFARY